MEPASLLRLSAEPASAGSTERDVFTRALETLTGARVPFLVGGMCALLHYANIDRPTKDLDVFARRRDVDRVLATLAGAGYRVERPYPHWLAKALDGEAFIDVIFNSGNGTAPVDDAWFVRAERGTLFGVPVLVSPVEETIWTKAFVQERERFDGADVLHLLRARGKTLDWEHLLARFAEHYRVLLAHLVLFGYAYPDARDAVPAWVLDELFARVRRETSATDRSLYATFLSREQYLVDLDRGYRDARLPPTGALSADEIRRFTPRT